MTMNASLHRLKDIKAECGIQKPETTWLELHDDIGNRVSVFMDARLADAIEEAFHEHENWLTSQEGPAFDEALGAKCDADARMDEARKLKGMV